MMAPLASLGGLFARLAILPSWVVGVLVAALGIAGAAVYFNDSSRWTWAIAAVGVAGLCLAIGSIAETLLPEAPVEATRVFGWRTLATFLMAGLGAAVVIAVAGEVTAPTDAEQAAIVKNAAAALTAAVTASLVKASETVDAPTAAAVESAFKKSYNKQFKNEMSAGHRVVFQDGFAGIHGWGLEARTKRAKEVEKAWPTRGDPPPNEEGN
jgi:Na+-transporting methylmalonyl-CoA/oxaloacetate decarboxylase gamma subunit